jgi:hypothetical protein
MIINKIMKNRAVIAWALILSIVYSLGAPVRSDPGTDPTEDIPPELNMPRESYDVPERESEELWAVMKKAAETEYLELRVLEEYEYDGFERELRPALVHDSNGVPVEYVDGMFEETENMVDIYNAEGEYIETLAFFALDRVNESDGVVHLTYREEVEVAAKKTMEAGMFAVRNKANGFIWWSNPINASRDPYANEILINYISSPLMFRMSNHGTKTPVNIYSNVIQKQGGSHNFTNALTGIDEISGGVRFNYNFPNRRTRVSMEVTLENDSVLVKIPQDRLVEDDIGDNGSIILTMSLLNSFGAGAEGEEGGYVVVPDGSGAIINFDNNKTNSAQYFGQVYGRDWSVSQKFSPPITQQVYLPVFGIVRGGEAAGNALVAIAEEGDENATIRVAVSRQGSRGPGNALANNTANNLAWFDFTMRTADTFRIGTENIELAIYESEYIKTGDIAVRYFPIAGEDVSYADVAKTYRNYLTDPNHVGITPVQGSNNTPFYMTVNGGTVKRHSILGFPVSLQTEATTYSQAGEMVELLKNNGVNDIVLTFNDFNTASIKRQVSTKVQYSSMLGGKRGFNNLSSMMSGNGFTLYPSLGFMEFENSGGGYNPMLHTPREVTRSRATQSRYELAFGTPDPLQKSFSILSPFYFGGAIDSIVKSLNRENISTVSLDQATWLLYSDFSRRNPFGNIYFNRRDTVEILTEGFAKLNQAGISIMAQSANAYALPYVSHISNVPLNSSNYDLFDYDVPFYQMVIGGLIPYSTTPFNANANLKGLMLKALATGTPVHYEFMYANAGDFNDSEYNRKFFASFRGWEDDAINMYKMFDDLIGDVVNSEIVKHSRVGLDEYETEFADGTKIRINLITYELRINGDRVDFSKYNLGGVVR